MNIDEEIQKFVGAVQTGNKKDARMHLERVLKEKSKRRIRKILEQEKNK